MTKKIKRPVKWVFAIILCLFAMMFLGLNLPALASSANTDQLPLWRKANVLYLGEHHDVLADHQDELEIIESLSQQSTELTLGLEMFQRPFQDLLDQYLADDIDADVLKTESDFDNRWGYDWEFYEPILAFAKAHNYPVKALNTPLEITRQVGQNGLQSLHNQDFQWIPPIKALDTSDPTYRARIQKAYNDYHQGQGNSTNFEHFYEAQILWDETMAEAIASEVNRHPDRLFVTLVGAGHIASNDGVPDRVKRRIQTPTFVQYSVILHSEDASATDMLQ